MRIRFGNPEALDYQTILYQITDFSFAKLSRSSVPFINYWRESGLRIAKIGDALGFRDEPDSDLFIEYPVRSKGRAKPSFSDAMYVSADIAIAFEAKWGEPCDTPVGRWRARRKHGDDVLEHWLGIIQDRADVQPDIDHIPYQLIHRTASAVSLHKRKAFVLFQVFKPAPPKSRSGDFAAAATEWLHCLRIKRHLEFWIQEIRLKETAHCHAAAKSITSSYAPDSIRQALVRGDLFEFEDSAPTPIT